MITHHGLDARVDRVTNNLLPVVEISQGVKAFHVDLGKRNLGVLRLSLDLGSFRWRLLSRLLLIFAELGFSTTTLLVATTSILLLIGTASHQVHLQVVESTLDKSFHLLLILLLSFVC